MTPKQIAFVREYLVDKNATQAAIRAGYSAKTASAIGEENLRKPDIRHAIDSAMSDIAEELGITAKRVLKERARIAFSDTRKLMHADGRMKLPNELDEDTAAAVVSFKIDELGRIEYRLAGKDSSLNALEKRLGLTEKPIKFNLPIPDDVAGCAKAQLAIMKALSVGAILPSEAEILAGMVEHQRRGLESEDNAKRLDAIEKLLKEAGKL